MPKVSIIIPYYNESRELLLRSVGSALGQTCKDFEIILINDGSDGEHTRMLEELYDNKPGVRILMKDNTGVSDTRNRAVKQATGDYIAFLDADDELKPCFLEEALTAAEQYGSDMVIGGVRLVGSPGAEAEVDGSGDVTVYPSGSPELKIHMIADMICYEGGHIGRGPVARLVRRELAEKTPFDPTLKIGEDIVWNLQLLEQAKDPAVVKRTWYLYHANPASATRKYNPEVIRQTAAGLREIRRYLDLGDDRMYRIYCERIMEVLKIVDRCFLSRSEWKASGDEKKRVLRKLKKTDPWNLLASDRYLRVSGLRGKVKAMLYRTGLLHLAWKLKGEV